MDNLKAFDSWVGKTESATDVICLNKVAALSATLNCEYVSETGGTLPPGWHWVFFNPVFPMSEVGHDGHPNKGNFLPPIDLPRRMWAGGRLNLDHPLKVGEKIERISTIKKISFKSGKSGNLAFVTVTHEINGSEGGFITEEQDIVYREAASGPKVQVSDISDVDKEPYDWFYEVKPDPVILFRYSALTFNGHRIHYDREYCILEEGYPGLVVHGPLTATLLLELARRHCSEEPVRSFMFRALRPLFDTAPYRVCGRKEGNTMRLWALDENGYRAMEAIAEV